jgi:hypothetical protein
LSSLGSRRLVVPDFKSGSVEKGKIAGLYCRVLDKPQGISMLHVTDEFVQGRQLVTLDVGALVACPMLAAVYMS